MVKEKERKKGSLFTAQHAKCISVKMSLASHRYINRGQCEYTISACVSLPAAATELNILVYVDKS